MNTLPIITIDFETYYDSKRKDPDLAPDGYSLKKMTTEEYVRHPWFETMGVAVKMGDSPTVWLNEEQFWKLVSTVDWSKVAVLCHHTHFDGLVLSHHYGVQPALWLDTLSMARALHAHESRLSLDALLKFYKAPIQKGDFATKMDGVHRADMTPEEYKAYGEYSTDDADGTHYLFKQMDPKFPELELKVIDMTIRMFTEPQFVADEEMLADFYERENLRRAELYERLGLTKKSFTSGEKFAQLLRDRGIEPPMKKSPKWEDGTNEKWIYAFAKTDPAMQMLLEDEDDEVRWLCEARISAKSTLDVSRTARFMKLGAGGQAMPVYLAYCAAHTHRWGGGDKMNWQNLRRVNKKKPDQGVIKRSIMAPEGSLVVRADSSQIEARGNAWFCGHHELCDTFARGEDVYSKVASTLYGRHVDRSREADFIAGFVGKTCTLGLGYGMGYYKAAMEFMKGALGGPPLVFKQADMDTLGVDPTKFLKNKSKIKQVEEMPSRLTFPDRLLHCIVTDHIVRKWRAANGPIMDMQVYLNDWVIPAMAAGDELKIGPRGCVVVEKDALLMPNGLRLHYHGLKQEKTPEGSEWKYEIEPGRWTKLYGGLLLENIIQCLSRIIVGLQALYINASGYGVRTLTHDEVVTIVRNEVAQEALDFLIGAMALKPDWAQGWPLAAEGGYHLRYGDAK